MLLWCLIYTCFLFFLYSFLRCRRFCFLSCKWKMRPTISRLPTTTISKTTDLPTFATTVIGSSRGLMPWLHTTHLLMETGTTIVSHAETSSSFQINSIITMKNSISEVNHFSLLDAKIFWKFEVGDDFLVLHLSFQYLPGRGLCLAALIAGKESTIQVISNRFWLTQEYIEWCQSACRA